MGPVDITLADLERAAACGSNAEKVRLRLMLLPFKPIEYDDWVELVDLAINYAISEMAMKRSDIQAMGEVSLTDVLLWILRAMGFSANSAVHNGNCDVTIAFANFTWLGEAKLYKGAAYVYGGYMQLTRRYANGMPGNNRCGLLIYCLKAAALQSLIDWRDALMKSDSKPNVGVLSGLKFSSSEDNYSSGLQMSIDHYAFPLYHDPDDDRPLNGAKRAKRTAKS